MTGRHGRGVCWDPRNGSVVAENGARSFAGPSDGTPAAGSLCFFSALRKGYLWMAVLISCSEKRPLKYLNSKVSTKKKEG